MHIMCSSLFKDLYGTPGAPKGAPFWAKDPFWGPLGFSRHSIQPKWGPNKPNAPHPSAACCLECYMCLQGYIGPPFQPQGPQKGDFALTSLVLWSNFGPKLSNVPVTFHSLLKTQTKTIPFYTTCNLKSFQIR